MVIARSPIARVTPAVARARRQVRRRRHVFERQRDLVRAVGVETMHWTFDPLVARNAHLNLTRLGARAIEYVPDMYGTNTGSPIHGALPTDRVIVAWDLSRPPDPVERTSRQRPPSL